jgi:predicted nicotinamide N-methyase
MVILIFFLDFYEFKRGQTDLLTFPQYDIILCADLVYHHKIITPLLKTIHKLARFDSVVFFLFESHNAEAAEAFWKKVNFYFQVKPVIKYDFITVKCID